MSGARSSRSAHTSPKPSDGKAHYGCRAPVAGAEGGKLPWGSSSPTDGRAGRREGEGSLTLTNEVLLDLLQRRSYARSVRDFDTSDRIREEMRRHGVFPDDRTRTWKTQDGRSGSLEGPDFFGSSSGAGGTGVTATVVGCYLSDRHIRDMLAEREQARMEKDYARADDIRSELNRYGVSTDDRNKTWRCSDGRSGSYSEVRGHVESTISSRTGFYTGSYGGGYGGDGGYKPAARLPHASGYTSGTLDPAPYYPRSRSRSPVRGSRGYGGGRTSTIDRHQDIWMVELLRKRNEARQHRDWATSGRLREQLADMGVTTDDRAKVWRSRDGRVGRLEGPDFLSPPGYGGATVGYGTALGSGAGSYGGSVGDAYGGERGARVFLSDADIHDHLVAREQARRAKDYSGADEIRRTLQLAGVTICDRTKSWKAADGRSGGRPDSRGNVEPLGYMSSAAPHLSDDRMDSYGGYRGTGYAGSERYSGRQQREDYDNGYGSYSSGRYNDRFGSY